MGRKGQSITLSVSAQDKSQLEAIAREQEMMWGGRPNVSRLIEAIARRELLIGRNNDWSETRIRAMQHAIQALTDAGHPDSAQIIAQSLLERSELSAPLRAELERYLKAPLPSWRVAIDQCIQRQTPFQLTYRDAADHPWSFTIRHARITPYERRQYLECWCEEAEGNRDIPALQHNWTLRLDRIPEAALNPIQGRWRSDLDTLQVEMHLLQGLAFAYECKSADVSNEWVRDHPSPVRRIVRKISNTFWFFREVLRYGEDCVIISPKAIQAKFKQKLRSMYKHYNVVEKDT